MLLLTLELDLIERLDVWCYFLRYLGQLRHYHFAIEGECKNISFQVIRILLCLLVCLRTGLSSHKFSCGYCLVESQCEYSRSKVIYPIQYEAVHLTDYTLHKETRENTRLYHIVDALVDIILCSFLTRYQH
jgi:hypothetical protein